MIKFNSPLWGKYQKICNSYLKKFCDKHGYDYDDAKENWVADFTGTITCCGDNWVSLETIIIDIESNAPEDEFLKWYDYCLECNEVNTHSCNYDSWLLGCPRHTREELKRIGDMKSKPEKDRINELRTELENVINQYLK